MSPDKNTRRRTAGGGDNGLGGAYAGFKSSYGDAAQPKDVCQVSRQRPGAGKAGVRQRCDRCRQGTPEGSRRRLTAAWQ